MWAELLSQVVPAATQQRNNTNAHSYVMPNNYSQAPFYLTILGIIVVMAIVGYVLFKNK